MQSQFPQVFPILYPKDKRNNVNAGQKTPGSNASMPSLNAGKYAVGLLNRSLAELTGKNERYMNGSRDH